MTNDKIQAVISAKRVHHGWAGTINGTICGTKRRRKRETAIDDARNKQRELNKE